MSAPANALFTRLIDTLTATPWGPVVTIIFQVALLALVARLLVWRIGQIDSAWIHRIWCTAILLSLAILPIHLSIGGWALPVPLRQLREPLGGSVRQLTGKQTTSHQVTANIGSSALALSRQNQPAQVAGHFDDSVASALSSQLATSSPSGAADLSATSAVPSVDTWGSLITTPLILLSIYCFGVCVITLRLWVGAIRLNCVARKGQRVGRESAEIARSVAKQMGQRSVMIRMSDEIMLPLVFGASRPTILVPIDFDQWSIGERHAAFLHEMTHVRRRDCLWQFIAILQRTIYWFHPAGWYLHRQLSVSREWATDQEAVWLAAKSDSNAPEVYAECLLNIVSRAIDAPRESVRTLEPALAMSAFGGLEDRIERILKPGDITSGSAQLLNRVSLLILVLLAVSTTFRLEPSKAQEVAATVDLESSARDEVKESGEEPVQAVWRIDEHFAKEDNGLFHRIKTCQVRETAVDPACVFQVEGHVVSASGEPVAGAVVVFRETESGRRPEGMTSRYANYQSRIRFNDVLARTVTDDEGRFQFTDVGTPNRPLRRKDRWTGHVVAAHPSLGIGWHYFGGSDDVVRKVPGVQIKLTPTESVSGRFTTPDRSPIENGIVSLVLIGKADHEDYRNHTIAFHRSELMPCVRTKADGYFELTDVPVGNFIAVCCTHEDWETGTGYITTSDDASINEHAQRHFHPASVLTSPAEIAADPGVILSGTVTDTDGKPVPRAVVSYGYSFGETQADDLGVFRLRMHRETVRQSSSRSRPNQIRVNAPKSSGLVSSAIDFPSARVLDGEQAAIRLRKGIAVRGKVVDDSGAPLTHASVRTTTANAGFPALTDDEGVYELMLAAVPHVLCVSTNQPGWQLPTFSESSFQVEPEFVPRFPNLKIDLTGKEGDDALNAAPELLAPIVVPRMRPVSLSVVLPSGQPAVGASAILRDYSLKTIGIADDKLSSSRVIDRSNQSTTDAKGQVSVLPTGVQTEHAYLQLRLLTDAQAFDAKVAWADIVGGQTKITVDVATLMTGRVLIDGQPIENARLSVGEMTPMMRTVNGRTFTGSTVNNHRWATTDQTGTYRLPVSRGKVFSVSLQKVPSVDMELTRGVGFQSAVAQTLVVPTYELRRGTEAIAGRVFDVRGISIEGATVEIEHTNVTSPYLWIDHKKNSRMITDKEGRFHLRNVPNGTYRLQVRSPRDPVTRRSASTSYVSSRTGNMHVRITLDHVSVDQIPTLRPVRIQAFDAAR
ncbi:M56 family metallopeptidase [Planctomycetes bacterium K23_9]|uniref:Regulatory protein BlaR1 n=1 Tax=Stieleria marina TaxID=1930275 RepID=A0A517NX08_9BACT|nr:Regulatory protein BlaR1 [Planctomycetes bacterium K23_9]